MQVLFMMISSMEFRQIFLSKNSINKNKNGYGSYSFSESNYKAGNCGSGHKLTWDFVQGDVKYDAARKNMREPWIMPTFDQCYELVYNNNTIFHFLFFFYYF